MQHRQTLTHRIRNGADSLRSLVSAVAALALAACLSPAGAQGAGAPVSSDDAWSTPESAAFAAPAPGVLGNDSDPDGDPLTAVLVTPPAHGSVDLYADGSFNYMPSAYYVGTDHFTYKAGDGTFFSAPSTVSITVTPVNFPPVANADAYATTNETVYAIAAPGILGNDTDPDGDALTVADAAPPAHGTLSWSADGSFTYVAARGFVGTDYFTYRVGDGSLESAPATVAIAVTAGPHGSGSLAPELPLIGFSPAASCTAVRQVKLALHAHNAWQTMLSDRADFLGASWRQFDYDVDEEFVDWTLPAGDGAKTVYVKFKSPSGIVTDAVSASITLDEKGLCGGTAPKPALPPGADACMADFNDVEFHPYMVTADGAELHEGSDDVAVEPVSPNTTRYRFMRTGKTGRYAAVTLLLEVIGGKVDVHLESLNASSGDKVRLRIHDLGRILDDVTLWDSVTTGGTAKTYDVQTSIVRCRQASTSALKAGDLIKGAGDAVYFFGKDGRRHVFPDRAVFDSWYADFSAVKTVTQEELSAVPLGANVRFKPGTRLVKIVSDPKVYAIAEDGALRWVHDEAVAAALFGDGWAKTVEDIDPALFGDYGLGADLVSASGYVRPSPTGIGY